jgi:hypothetical protein
MATLLPDRWEHKAADPMDEVAPDCERLVRTLRIS